MVRLHKQYIFNMAPVIDIVFLLIIFFLLVCRYIDTDSFQVKVPDCCDFSQIGLNTKQKFTTVTVTEANQKIVYAVGAKIVVAENDEAMVNKLAETIDDKLLTMPINKRQLVLRIDKDMQFKHVEKLLKGLGQSCASKVQLSVFQEKQNSQ